MSKKEWSIVIFPLFFVWILDRLTKIWAIDLVNPMPLGFLKLIYVENHGAMLGLFSDLPAVLRIVSLSTGGAFLVCTYAILQYLLPIKSITLRSGMSILLGGILGNVCDRIIYGYVIDFISIHVFNYHSPVFNIADAVQWLGYFMIVTALIREGEILWPENEQRKRLWINPTFQLKYCMILVAVGVGISLISGVFSYTYLRVTIVELVGQNSRLLDRFVLPFLMTYAVVSIAFLSILFLIGRYISHRVAGPLFAFERFLKQLVSGDYRHFKLRSNDEFKHLEPIAGDLKTEMIRLRQAPAEVPQEEQSDQLVFDLQIDADK